MKDYVYLGSQPYESESEQLRVEPSAEGTPFSASFSLEREKALIEAGLVRLADAPRRRAEKS